MKEIMYSDYKRRVFNTALLEALAKFEITCCEIDPEKEPDKIAMAKKMTDVFYTDLLDLDNKTISATRLGLQEAVSFVQDMLDICEAVADQKASDAAEHDLEVPENQKIELSDEDEEVIKQLFDEKNPTVQIDQVRDSTVKALMAENRKSQEIKDALDIAQAQVQSGENKDAVQETSAAIGNRGPTSLMNAIMNSMAGMAFKDVNENSTTPVSINQVMSENAEEIKNRSILAYSLYEGSSVLGIHKWTQAELKHEADRIYYGS